MVRRSGTAFFRSAIGFAAVSGVDPARQLCAKSRLGEAIRYALTRWDGLVRFLDDGRLDLDNNAVEHVIRALALETKVE